MARIRPQLGAASLQISQAAPSIWLRAAFGIAIIVGATQAKADVSQVLPASAAQLFVEKCNGCHTIGEGELFGPDLKSAPNRSVNDLRDAVKRMEPFVDSLDEGMIHTFVDFLRTADAGQQLADAQHQIARTQTATSDSAAAAVREALHATLTQTSTPAADISAPPADITILPGAKLFLQKCSGCHSIGRGNLSGPDLKPTSAWPETDLRAAVQRMEKSVGPMDEAEIALLTELLLDPTAGSQVQDAQQQVVLAQTAKLEPGSAARGKELFRGQRSFSNGGLACTACHTADGRGGTLAKDLHTSFTRLGAMPLMSSMENPAFPLMRAVYTNRAITKQEAAHVTTYLESIAEQPAPAAAPPVHLAGMGLAAAAIVGIAVGYRKRLRGVRSRLVRRASSHRSGSAFDPPRRSS